MSVDLVIGLQAVRWMHFVFVVVLPLAYTCFSSHLIHEPEIWHAEYGAKPSVALLLMHNQILRAVVPLTLASDSLFAPIIWFRLNSTISKTVAYWFQLPSDSFSLCPIPATIDLYEIKNIEKYTFLFVFVKKVVHSLTCTL